MKQLVFDTYCFHRGQAQRAEATSSIFFKAMSISIHPKAILKALFLFTLGLTLLNLIGVVAKSLGHGSLLGFVQMFDFNLERNVPTLYSSTNLMFSALLLMFVAAKHKAIKLPWVPWVGLSAVFCLLSIDEFFELHERTAAPVQQLLNISKDFYYVWSIPYLLFIGVLFLLYFKLLMRLPERTRFLFILAGILFISGAVGFEAIGNFQSEIVQSRETLAYRLFVTCEEFLEMLSIVIFIYSLFDYIVVKFGSIVVQVDSDTPTHRA